MMNATDNASMLPAVAALIRLVSGTIDQVLDMYVACTSKLEEQFTNCLEDPSWKLADTGKRLCGTCCTELSRTGECLSALPDLSEVLATAMDLETHSPASSTQQTAGQTASQIQPSQTASQLAAACEMLHQLVAAHHSSAFRSGGCKLQGVKLPEALNPWGSLVGSSPHAAAGIQSSHYAVGVQSNANSCISGSCTASSWRSNTNSSFGGASIPALSQAAGGTEQLHQYSAAEQLVSARAPASVSTAKAACQQSPCAANADGQTDSVRATREVGYGISQAAGAEAAAAIKLADAERRLLVQQLTADIFRNVERAAAARALDQLKQQLAGYQARLAAAAGASSPAACRANPTADALGGSTKSDQIAGVPDAAAAALEWACIGSCPFEMDQVLGLEAPIHAAIVAGNGTGRDDEAFVFVESVAAE